MWISDTLTLLRAKLIGRAELGYDRWEYELPFSKRRVIVGREEQWQCGDVMAQGSTSLWEFAYSDERKLEHDRNELARQMGQRNYADAMAVVEAIRLQVAEYEGESAELKTEESFEPSNRFPGICIRTGNRSQVWVGFANLDSYETPNSESGKVLDGAVYGRSFKGLRGLKMAAKKRFQQETVCQS